MTQVKMFEAVLHLLNKMNVSLSKAIVELKDAGIHDLSHYREDPVILNNLNIVMNGITSLTSIYSEAYKQSIATNFEKIPENPHDEKIVKESVPVGKSLKSNAAALLNEGKDRIINSIRNATKGISEVIEQISDDVSPESRPQESITENETKFEDIIYAGNLSELIGDSGLLFKHLSPELHPDGKGTIKPSARFPAFIEDIKVVAISDLVDYPEGFYDTRDGHSNQWFLRLGPIEYLWLFTKTDRELLIRSGSEWTSVFTIPKGSVKMITQLLSVRMQTF
jgi:hypothetical protein